MGGCLSIARARSKSTWALERHPRPTAHSVQPTTCSGKCQSTAHLKKGGAQNLMRHTCTRADTPVQKCRPVGHVWQHAAWSGMLGKEAAGLFARLWVKARRKSWGHKGAPPGANPGCKEPPCSQHCTPKPGWIHEVFVLGVRGRRVNGVGWRHCLT